MTQGGPAQPVALSAEAPDGGPALCVAVVSASDGYVISGGPSQPIVVVADGRSVQGNTPIPVMLGSGPTLGGAPIPVVVVSGSFDPLVPPGPCNGTGLDFSCSEDSGHIVTVGL